MYTSKEPIPSFYFNAYLLLVVTLEISTSHSIKNPRETAIFKKSNWSTMPFYNLLVFKFTNFDYDSKLLLQTNSKWPIKCRGFNEAPSHKGKISYKCPGSNEQPGLQKWALKLSTNFKRMKRRTFAINFRRKFGRKLAILWKIYLPDTFCSFYFFTFFDKYPGSIMRSVLISV